jgi:hypothetical protein
MPEYLKQQMKKARLTLDYLNANGGALPEEVRDRFIVLTIKKSDFLSSVTTTNMQSQTFRIPTWEIENRAMYRRTRGQALTDAQRTRPTTTGPIITAYDYAAEVVLEKENLESGVEGPQMLNLVMRTLSDKVSQDAADIAINSNPASTDDTLVNFNGFYTGVTSNTSTAGSTRFSPVNATSHYKSLPSQFQKPGMTMRIGTNGQIDYGNAVQDRPTTLGDDELQGRWRPHWKGHEVKADQFFPQTLGGSNNETLSIVSDEKDFWVGFHRRITSDNDEDIRAQTIFVVFTMRMGANWSAQKMAAKQTAILAS